MRAIGVSRRAAGAAALCAAILALAAGTASAASAVPLIVDTDIYTNVDDVGALASALALQNGGEAKLLAVTVNVPVGGAVAPDQARCVAAIDSFYGSSVPIGVQTGLTGNDSGSPYVGACASGYSTPATDTAVNVDTSALSAQPDHSVVMVSIGFMGNLAALLKSSSSLVAQKVKTLVVMGGGYPSYGPETNFEYDPASAEYVAANWPTPIVWDGYEIGSQIDLGQTIPSSQPSNSPVRVAYKAYDPSGKAIPSFDPTAMYYAIRPSTPFYSQSGSGTNSITTSGNESNTFTPSSGGTQNYLTLSSRTGLTCSIEALLDSQAGSSGTGQISGTVNDASAGGGMANLTVQAYDPMGNQVESTTTASDGTYTLSGLPAGCYTVGFMATGKYSPKYYNGASTLGAANLISVPVGATVSGVSATFGVAPPRNTGMPSISGTAALGQTLQLSPGSWANATGVTDQWEDCNPAGNACVPVGGATGSTYALTASDVGNTIRVAESATNAGGLTGPVLSAPTAVVAGLPSSPPPPPVGGGNPPVSQPGQNQGHPSTTPAGLKPAAIRALLVKLLARQGRGTRIGALLRGNGLSFSFAAPAPGRLVVSWNRGNMLVATVTVTFNRARTATVRLVLTRAGRRMLRGAARVRISARASFRPTGQGTTRAGAAMILRR